jgi:cysteine desulfurase family protein
MVYLDNAATTFPKPQCVYEALEKSSKEYSFNAGRGAYKASRIASEIIDDTRKEILSLIGNCNGQVYFSSSATESLNQIIFGINFEYNDYVYISPFEHNSVVRPLFEVARTKGIHIELIPFDKSSWQLDIDRFKVACEKNRPKAVFVSQVSNVTGYILPYGSIFEISAKYDAINVLDSSQSFGILSVDVKNTDYVVFAGHKSLYGPFGIAGFIQTKRDYLRPIKFGGTGSDTLNHMMAEKGSNKYEAGSLNSTAIATLNTSIKWLKITPVEMHERTLTSYLIKRLCEIRKVRPFIPSAETDIFGICSFIVEGYEPEDVGSILDDEYDISVRTGYHCAPFVHDFLGTINNGGTIRCSMGYYNTEKDIDYLMNALNSL